MNNELKKMSEDMKELGLAALSHANKIHSTTTKGGELAVLKAAHAAEILIKARIAEEHPLLIFEKFPQADVEQLSITSLFDKGRTYEWNKLPQMLWATTGYNMAETDETFKKFGFLRNGIQHWGVISAEYRENISAELETKRFIYSVIDSMIYDWWKLSAIDYCEDRIDEEEADDVLNDNSKYWNYVKSLVDSNIKFNASQQVCDFLTEEIIKWLLENCSHEYRAEFMANL